MFTSFKNSLYIGDQNTTNIQNPDNLGQFRIQTSVQKLSDFKTPFKICTDFKSSQYRKDTEPLYHSIMYSLIQ